MRKLHTWRPEYIRTSAQRNLPWTVDGGAHEGAAPLASIGGPAPGPVKAVMQPYASDSVPGTERPFIRHRSVRIGSRGRSLDGHEGTGHERMCKHDRRNRCAISHAHSTTGEGSLSTTSILTMVGSRDVAVLSAESLRACSYQLMKAGTTDRWYTLQPTSSGLEHREAATDASGLPSGRGGMFDARGGVTCSLSALR